MRRERVGLSEATTVVVLALVALVAVGIVLIWGAMVSSSATGSARQAAETQVLKMRQDVSLVYWGPDGTIILTSRAKDPVTIVYVYVDSARYPVPNCTINPGETKPFCLRVSPYDPLKQLTAVTDRNEIIVLWRPRGP